MLIINNHSYTTSHGLHAAKGAWEEWVNLPTPKPRATQQWQEHSGEEVDPTPAPPAPRQLSLPVIVRGTRRHFLDLIDHLRKLGLFTLQSDYIQRTFAVRFLHATDIHHCDTFTLATLRMVEDRPPALVLPHRPPTSQLLIPARRPAPWLTIDGLDIERLSAYMLEGCFDALAAEGIARQWLTRSLPTTAGQVHDNDAPTHPIEAYEASLPLAFIGSIAPDNAGRCIWAMEDTLRQMIYNSSQLLTIEDRVHRIRYRAYFKSAKTTDFHRDKDNDEALHLLTITLRIVEVSRLVD